MVKHPEEDHETSLLLGNGETRSPDTDDDEQVFRRQALISSPTNFGNEEPPLSGGYLPAIAIQDPNMLQPTRKRTNVFHSFPNSPNQSRMDLAVEMPTSPANSSSTQTPVDELGSENGYPLPHHRPCSSTVPTSSPFHSFCRRCRRRLGRTWRAFNEFMTVPLWAAILALIVACVRPLQHALEDHLQPIKGALASAGNCSIPLTLVVLGAYFYNPPPPEDVSIRHALSTKISIGSLSSRVRNMFRLETRHRRTGSSNSLSVMPKPEGRPGETKTVAIAIISRMFIVPILLIPLMAVSTWYDWHAIFAE